MSEKTANHEWEELEGYELICHAVRQDWITEVECAFDIYAHIPTVHVTTTKSCPEAVGNAIYSFLRRQVEDALPDEFNFSGSFGLDEKGVFLTSGRIYPSDLHKHFGNDDKPGWNRYMFLHHVDQTQFPHEWDALCEAMGPAMASTRPTAFGLVVTHGDSVLTANSVQVNYSSFLAYPKGGPTYDRYEITDSDSDLTDEFEVEVTDELKKKIPSILSSLSNAHTCDLDYFEFKGEPEWEGYHEWVFLDRENISESWVPPKQYIG